VLGTGEVDQGQLARRSKVAYSTARGAIAPSGGHLNTIAGAVSKG